MQNKPKQAQKRVFLPLGPEMEKLSFLKEDSAIAVVRGPESYPKCPGFQTYYKRGPDYTAPRGVLINTIQI